MLLLLKTNDLLRGIETKLETRNSASSFIHMTKCCVRLINSYERDHNSLKSVKKIGQISSFLNQLKFYLLSVFKEHIYLFKIYAYELFLFVNFL